MEGLDRRRELRTRFMDELYEEANGADFQPVATMKIASKMGFDISGNREDSTEVLTITRYLQGEGLLKLAGNAGSIVTLTHQGVREMEQAKSQPDRPTEHFAAINNIYVGTMTNSQIQQGSPGATQDLNNIVGQEQIQGVRPVVRDLRNKIDDLGLDGDDRAELEAEIQALEAQMTSPKPKKDITESGLRSAQRILEGTAAGAASSGLLQAIQTALSLL